MPRLTATKWDTWEYPLEMICETGSHSDRRSRLFALACIERYRQFLTDPHAVGAFEYVESCDKLDGIQDQITRKTFREMLNPNSGEVTSASLNNEIRTIDGLMKSALIFLLEDTVSEYSVIRRTIYLAGQVSRLNDNSVLGDKSRVQVISDEMIAIADLIRDVYGNPFRPVNFASSWRTSAVLGIAETIYADRTFGNLPVLADALEEAGCDHADVLSHCRGPGPHVRGCWVVDLVLGKS